MDQPVPVGNAHSPALAAASVYRLLLADEIAVALSSGASVAATGTRDTDDILDLTANALIETGARVLQFRPPLDGPSFISQFAIQWRVTGKGLQDLLPQASGERFVMLFHEAHTMAPETLQHLDRMARAWPGMQMAFAGLSILADLLQSEEHPAIKRRVTVFTKIAVSEEPQQQPLEQHHAAPATTTRPEQPNPTSSIPTFTIPSGNLGRTGYYPITKRQQQTRKRRRIAAFVSIIAAAGLATAIATIPEMQEWAGTARTYVANLRPDTPVKVPPVPAPPNREATNQAATQPATPSEPAPPPLWTAPSPDAPPSQTGHPATQLTLLGDQQAPSPPSSSAKADPEPPVHPREASEPSPPAPASAAPQEVAALAPPPEPPPEPAPEPLRETPPAPPQTPTRTISPTSAIKAEPPQSPAPPVLAPPTATASLPSISPELAEAMTKRGRAMLEWGDVSAARLLLTRATSAGSGEAALLMGTTFDAATLDRIGAVGIPPDPIQAAAWYRVALALGEERARAMLENEPTNIANAKPKDNP